MKKIKYIAIGLLIAMSGCSDFLNINNNPNAPAQSVPDPVLAGALAATANIMAGGTAAFAPYWAGYWAASGTYSSAGNVTQNFKIQTSSFGQAPWGGIYLNMANYTFVENTAGKGFEYYKAIAKIMKVYGYHTLVDCYGKIPYTDSELGFRNLSPKYDDDRVVYEKLVNKLDSAIAIIQPILAQGLAATAKVVPKTADVMFGGDMNKWVRLANTMKLRLLIRMSNVPSEAAFITSAIASITANGAGFLGAGEDAAINPGYQKAAGLQNPLWEGNGLGVGGDVGFRDFNRTSEYSRLFFANNNDPRILRLFRKPSDLPGVNTGTVASDYASIPWGTPPTTQYVSSSTSGMGIGVMGSPSQSVFFLTAAESFFLQAEAAQRGWLNTGQEQTLYQTGITESFRQLGVPSSATAAIAYYTSGKLNVDWSVSADKRQAIIVQKWAANCSIDAMESWCDVRRTGFPNVPLSLDPNKGNLAIPTPIRILYPLIEYTSNPQNIPPNIDLYTSKVFWNQ